MSDSTVKLFRMQVRENAEPVAPAAVGLREEVERLRRESPEVAHRYEAYGDLGGSLARKALLNLALEAQL